VKAVIIDLPMIYAGWLNEDSTLNEVEKNWKKPHLDGLKLLCENPEEQFAKKDPWIFPAEMDVK